MSKYSKIVLIGFFASMLGLLLFQHRPSTSIISLGGHEIEVMVAKTPKQLYRGLGKRDNLAPYDGMMFLFHRHGHHGIVMRDMRFAIDIVWLSDGEVVDIAPNVPVEIYEHESELMVYRPRKEANVVIELPAGWSGAHELEIGDRVEVIQP